MSKLKRPQFFAMFKDFNDGKMKPTDVLFCIFNYHEAPNAEFLYRELRPSVNGLNSSYPFTASSTKRLSITSTCIRFPN